MGPPPPRPLGSALGPAPPASSSLLLPRTSAGMSSSGPGQLSGDADAGVRATNDDAQVSKL